MADLLIYLPTLYANYSVVFTVHSTPLGEMRMVLNTMVLIKYERTHFVCDLHLNRYYLDLV